MKDVVIPNPWAMLRRHTPARIALGRSGISMPTAAHLDFQLAHAQARDAVHRPFDIAATAAAIAALGLETQCVHSAAADRHIYLQRPDLGRRLDEAAVLPRVDGGGCDLAFAVADGLSALAVERNAEPFLAALLPLLRADAQPWQLGPAVLVQQGRVAIGDDIGERIGARLMLMLIGERPGLSSPDSMGLYLTWSPHRGCSDAQRNCISNVRPEGLSWVDAAARTVWLLRAARQRGLTGVALKDESAPVLQVESAAPNFLLPNSPAARE